MPSSQNSRIANPDFADAHSAGGAVLQGRQAALDPVTADYSGVTIRSLQNAVYVRIVTPRGSYWDDPQMGSRLHLLKREKDLSNREQRAQDYIREALQPILDDSRADDIRIQTQWRGDGRLYALTEVWQAGRPVARLDFPVEVE